MVALTTRIKNAWNVLTNNGLPGPASDFWYTDTGASRAGMNVNSTSALTLSSCWAATNAIASLFGKLPCKVFRTTGDGREVQPQHPVHRIVGREPNSLMDSFIFWEMLTHWWVNYGNAYAEIVRTETTGRIVALYPIHPTRVKPERDLNGEWTGRYVIKSRLRDVVLESDELLNIVGPLSDDGVTGKGLLLYAASAIGVGLAEQKYQGDFYANGGRPSGVLEHPSKLGPDTRDQLRKEWRMVHGQSNQVAVLWEGLKFNPLSVDPEHAQLVQSRVFSVQELCRFYDLPPHVLYELSNGTFANVEEMNRFLVSHSFGNRIVRVEKALDRQLFSEREKEQDYYTKFNVNALLRGNPKEQAEINQIKFNCGALSQDEWRAQDDQNKLADDIGSQYWVRRDLAPITLVLNSADASASTVIPGTPPTPPTPAVPGNHSRLNGTHH